MFYILFASFMYKTSMPMPLLNMLKNNIKMDNSRINNFDYNWEKSFSCKNIINKYFNKCTTSKYLNNNENYYGEIFRLYGYPAAIVIINNKKYVKEFIINKSLILMFDAGPYLRKSFYENFKNYKINNALNKNEFLII